MKSLVFSPAVQADMEAIWDYIVEHQGFWNGVANCL